MRATVVTNGRVSIVKDVIFGFCVMGENGWLPFSRLNAEDKKIVASAIDFNPTILAVYPDVLDTLIERASA